MLDLRFFFLLSKLQGLDMSSRQVNYDDPLLSNKDKAGGDRGTIESLQLSIARFVESVRELSASQLLLVGVCVILVVGGNAGQLISLNIWVNHFPTEISPPYPILTISATTIATAFTVSLIVRLALFGGNCRFLLCWKGLLLSLAIGCCNSLNGVLLVYATQPTPEILQALLLTTQVFWTLVSSKILLRDERSLFHVLVFLSFALSAGGIILGASPTFDGTDMTTDVKYWSLIFAASMIPGALYNVFASMYMRSFTKPKQPAASHYSKEPLMLGYAADQEHEDSRSDDTTVKLVMLSVTGFSQVMWMFVLFPLDSATWFGPQKDLEASKQNLDAGWKCVFGSCSSVYLYYLLFNGSYLCNYLGSAYLNHYSATLNSMVTQLSSPVAALLLIAVPSWNVQKEPVKAGISIAAAFMIIAGSLLYSAWEHTTRAAAERLVKERASSDDRA